MCIYLQTLAQVKLRIKDLKGEKVVVTRSLKATQKAKRLEVKTMDATITRGIKATGEVRLNFH